MKQLIKGTNISLYSGDEIEIVNNVLISNGATTESAEMSESGGKLLTYTLAIPKYDTHNWTNRIIGFYGEKFRTTGFEIQGIEENMPLQWNKQIKVQKLNITGYCTVYDSENYRKHIFENVYYSDNRGTNIQTDGRNIAGSLVFQIYADRFRQEHYTPKVNDIIVPGKCSFEFNTKSEQSISESMAEFRKLKSKIFPGINTYLGNKFPLGASVSLLNLFGIIKDVKKVSYGGDIPDYIIGAS